MTITHRCGKCSNCQELEAVSNKLKEQWPCLLSSQRPVSIGHWTKDDIEQWHSQQHQGLPIVVRECPGCGCLISTGTTCKRCADAGTKEAAEKNEAERTEHMDTGPHDGCSCTSCLAAREQQAIAAMRWGGEPRFILGALLKRMGVTQLKLNATEVKEGSTVLSYDPTDGGVIVTLVKRP